MTEVVAALIWKESRFLICQRPAHKATAVCCGNLSAAKWSQAKPKAGTNP